MTKLLTKLGIEGTFLAIVKAIYRKPTESIILNGKKVKSLSSKIWHQTNFPLSTFVFNLKLELFGFLLGKKKNIYEWHPDRKEKTQGFPIVK